MDLDWHEWIPVAMGLWKCSHCLKQVAAVTRDELGLQGCKGIPSIVKDIHATHEVVYPEIVGQKKLRGGYDGKPMAICLKCGCFGQIRAIYLREPCKGKPPLGSSGQKALDRVSQGLHPRNVGHDTTKAVRVVLPEHSRNAFKPPSPQAPEAHYSKHAKVPVALAKGAPGGRLQALQQRVLDRLAKQG